MQVLRRVGRVLFEGPGSVDFIALPSKARFGSSAFAAKEAEQPPRLVSGAAARAARVSPQVLGKEIKLKNGIKAKASLLTHADKSDLAEFFDNLDERALLGAARCHEPHVQGTDGLAEKWCAEALATVGSASRRFVIVRAPVGGASAIVGGCMMIYSDDKSCKSELLLTEPRLRGSGIATLVKQAQFERARSESMRRMDSRVIHDENGFYASPALATLYHRAGKAMGMRCERVAVDEPAVPGLYQVRVHLTETGR